jgi:hypothetical protein
MDFFIVIMVLLSCLLMADKTIIVMDFFIVMMVLLSCILMVDKIIITMGNVIVIMVLLLYTLMADKTKRGPQLTAAEREDITTIIDCGFAYGLPIEAIVTDLVDHFSKMSRASQ